MLGILILGDRAAAEDSCSLKCFEATLDCYEVCDKNTSLSEEQKVSCKTKDCKGQKEICDTFCTAPGPSSPPLLNIKDAGGRLYLLNIKNTMGSKPFEQVLGGYIKGALALVGIIFLMLMVYGGYIWMIARGDEQEATRAKHIIQMATIGMVIILIAYAVTFLIVERLTSSII